MGTSASAELSHALTELGSVLTRRGKYVEAEPLLAEALALRDEIYGRESLEAAEALFEIGLLAHKTGETDVASGALSGALDIRRRLLTAPDPALALSIHSYANTLMAEAAPGAAVPFFEEALEMWRQLGDTHLFERASTENDLGIVLHGLGRWIEAEELYRSSLDAVERIYGADHPAIADHMTNLGKVLIDQGRFRDAQPVLDRAVELTRAHREPTHFDRIGAEINMGTLLVGLGEFEEAVPIYADTVDRFGDLLGRDHPFTGMIIGYLGWAQLLAGNPVPAEANFDRAIAILSDSPFAADLRASIPLLGLGCRWRDSGRLDESLEPLAAALEMRSAGARTWFTAEAEVELGEALRRLGETQRARDLLEAGYATLLDTRGPDDWLTRRASGYLETLETATG